MRYQIIHGDCFEWLAKQVDPFMGSGSTLAAAEALGYPSVGVEIDPEFVEIAKRAVPKLAGLEVEWQSFEGANGNAVAGKEAENMSFTDMRLESDRQGAGECHEEASVRYGTFQDSLQAPIHRWFQYPAGFSYKLIEAKIQERRLGAEHWIFDPFVGCGTTLVAAKLQGVNAVGIEAHPFVHWVARIKCHWEYHLPTLERMVNNFCDAVDEALTSDIIDQTDINEFPALVRKCYSPQNLTRLTWIRDAVNNLEADEPIKDFFRLALTATLRNAAKAGTGWPYIAPTKYHEKSIEKDACAEFKLQLRRMLRDLYVVTAGSRWKNATVTLILADARVPHPEVKEESVDLAITSPPYLNNYDYADRTRLEMYFWGWAKSWLDITHSVRDKLIIAATTQIRRSEFPSSSADALAESLRDADRKVYDHLRDSVAKLEQIRLRKGGKKSYDLMVAGYFNDMFQVLGQVYKAMKPGAEFVLVLGDSAPYGVYIPTEEYLGKLGVGIGFSSYKVEMLRKRGDKWANNSQRHHVALKESLLTLVK